MLTIKQMLNQLQAIFASYCAVNGGGNAVVCNDLTHMWAALLQGPTQLRILCVYLGETIRNTGTPGPAILGMVDRRFGIVVTRGRSLQINRGDSLTMDNAVGAPLFDIVEECRDICRGLLFDPAWTERTIDFSSVSTFNTEGNGVIVDAYQVDFSVGCLLPQMLDQPEQLETPV